jgi:hypothetical protein
MFCWPPVDNNQKKGAICSMRQPDRISRLLAAASQLLPNGYHEAAHVQIPDQRAENSLAGSDADLRKVKAVKRLR